MERLAAPGFSPARRDLPDLFALAVGEGDAADRALRALARSDLEVGELVGARWLGADTRARRRLGELVARRAGRRGDVTQLVPALLADADPSVRRHGANAAGKIDDLAALPALGRLVHDPRADVRRAAVTALGKLGGAEAARLLEGAEAIPGDALDTATERVARRVTAETATTLQGDRPLPAGTEVLFSVRRGLESLVAERVGARALRVQQGAVLARVTGETPGALLALSRVTLGLAFPIGTVRASADELGELAELVSSPRSLALVKSFTTGPLRYRIEWERGGPRRAATRELARAIARRAPELSNDPAASPWELVIEIDGALRHVSWRPRALRDERFEYRVRDVPAASHPTIAAALAEVAGAERGDVVWDPFVGSGLELVERARLGPARTWLACDLEATALDAARANFAAAGLTGVHLARSDARAFRVPEPVSLVLTNPPMGRRVARSEPLAALYRTFFDGLASRLAPRARLVWLSPIPEESARFARAVGLELTRSLRLDLGGFWVDLQRYERGATGPRAPAPARPRPARSSR